MFWPLYYSNNFDFRLRVRVFRTHVGPNVRTPSPFTFDQDVQAVQPMSNLVSNLECVCSPQLA